MRLSTLCKIEGISLAAVTSEFTVKPQYTNLLFYADWVAWGKRNFIYLLALLVVIVVIILVYRRLRR